MIFNRRLGGFRELNTPYRSGLEDKVAEQLRAAGIPAKYEKGKITYQVPAKNHSYTPDFILPNGIIVETKGIFEVADRQKHLLVKKQYPHLEIRFVFTNPQTKLYKGSKTSYADWCRKNGYKYAKGYIPAEWLRDKTQYPLEGVVFKK